MNVSQPWPSVLANRLEVGWNRIAEAEAAGQDVSSWEEFWISLLRNYEAACRIASGQE